MTAAISVIMPVYNAERYVEEAIASILNQSVDDFELIVINDGSTDSSAGIISSINDSRIRYFENSHNLGIIPTLNRGLSMVVSPYIARMDADDIALPTRFERQLSYMEANREVDILGTWFSIVESGDVVRHPVNADQCKIYLLLGPVVAHPTVMLRRESFEKHDLRFNRSALHAEDYKLWVDAVRSGLVIENIPEVLLRYRVHPEQVSRTNDAEQRRTTEGVAMEFAQYCFDDIPRDHGKTYAQLMQASFPNQDDYLSGKRLAQELLKHNNKRGILNQTAFKEFLQTRLKIAAHKIYTGDKGSLNLVHSLCDLYFYSGTTHREKLRALLKAVGSE